MKSRKGLAHDVVDTCTSLACDITHTNCQMQTVGAQGCVSMSFKKKKKSNQISYYPSCQLVYRTATKLLHPCLSLASLWMVPPLWFFFFISAPTVLHQVVFGRPRFCFPSGVQWIATLVMELTSLRNTCPIQCYRFLVIMVSVFSCWPRAKRSLLEMVLSQKMRWIFLRPVVGKKV